MIHIAGSKLVKQEPCQAIDGTSISIKNLFFNVPARRKFLKSEATEYKHILEEFHRIVLCYPEIKFSLFHNNNEIYMLPSSNLRQRIVNVFGKAMNEKLVPLEESTETLGIIGFIMKPQHARKTRGDQYLFVNNRFIKSNYMNHAIRFAFENLISADLHPGFFIYLTIDPSKIDVNVHPTKQEIKFEEERLIYNYIKVAIRHALGKHNLTPSLDFESSNFNSTIPNTTSPYTSVSSSAGTSQDGEMSPYDNYKKQEKANVKNWESLYEGLIDIEPEVKQAPSEDQLFTVESKMYQDEKEKKLLDDSQDQKFFQLHNRYILSPIKSGFILIDQQAAHERILYEQFLQKIDTNTKSAQQSLFPETIDLSAAQAEMLKSVLPYLNSTGWEIEDFGGNTFIIRCLPEEYEKQGTLKEDLLSLVENVTDEKDVGEEKKTIAKRMAKRMSVNKYAKLSMEEMRSLVNKLFACEHPYLSPSNKSVITTFTLEEILQRFNITK